MSRGVDQDGDSEHHLEVSVGNTGIKICSNLQLRHFRIFRSPDLKPPKPETVFLLGLLLLVLRILTFCLVDFGNLVSFGISSPKRFQSTRIQFVPL